MADIKRQHARVVKVFNRLGWLIDQLGEELKHHLHLEEEAQKMDEGKDDTTTGDAASNPIVIEEEDWDADDEAPFSLAPVHGGKKQTLEFCPVCRGKH